MKRVISIDNEKYKTLLDTGYVLSYNGVGHSYDETENIYVVRNSSVFDSETNTDINYIKNHESLDSAIQKLDEALYNRNTVDYSKNPVIYFGDITSVSNQVEFTTTITNFPTSAISDDTFLVLTKPNSFSDSTNKNVLIKISGNSTYQLTEVYRFNKNFNNQDWKPGQSLLMVLRDGRLFVICEYSNPTPVIPYVEVVNNNSATNFVATVPNVTKLTHGVCVYLKNISKNSGSGFTINVNGLGAKPVYGTQSGGRQAGIFVKGSTYLFIYNEHRVAGGCWDIYTGYDSNSNSIGYQIRTNFKTLPVTDTTGPYRILFTSADNTHFVPANTSTSISEIEAKTVNQRPINPFGDIVKCYNTTQINAESKPDKTILWQQDNHALGYSFNKTGVALTMTISKPVYVKAIPQSDGSAIIDADEPYVQDLPTTEDGYIYIYLGVANDATHVELQINHPIYYFKNGKVQPWFGQAIEDVTSLQNEINELKTKLTSISSANIINGYEYVDLCLPSGNLWATKNFGAEHAWDSGKVNMWSEINVSFNPNDDNAQIPANPFNNFNTFTGKYTKYNYTDSKIILDSEDDVVYQQMGEGWNIPSPEDYQELVKCTHQYVFTYNNVKIVAFISNINHNVLFIPLSGVYYSDGMVSTNNLGTYMSNEMFAPTSTSQTAANYLIKCMCLSLTIGNKVMFTAQDTLQYFTTSQVATRNLNRLNNYFTIRPVHHKDIQIGDPRCNYLTIESNSTFAIAIGFNWVDNLTYNRNKLIPSWENFDAQESTAWTTDFLQLRKKTVGTSVDTVTLSSPLIYVNEDNKYVKISGNICSLHDPNIVNFMKHIKMGVTINNLYQGFFTNLIINITDTSNLKFVDASELILPYPDATGVYQNLFKDCSYLINAPKYLYGDNVPEDAFNEAFSGCTKLEVAPILANSYLNARSYRKLFFNDTNLTNVKVSARNLSNNTTDGAENQLQGIDSKTSSGWLGKTKTGTDLNDFLKLSAVAKFNTFEPDLEYATDYHSSTHSAINYEINSQLTLQDLVDTIQKH